MTSMFTIPDVEWNDVFDAYAVAYEAQRYGEPWSGGATPVVTTKVMHALVARMQFLAVAADFAEDVDHWRWDGNGVRVVPFDCDPDDDTDATWLLPADDGTFDLAPLGYTFVRLEEDDRVFQPVGD